MRLDVKYDSREIDVFLNKIAAKGINKAVARSLNRTGVNVRKETARLINEKLGGRVAIGAIKAALPSLERARANQSIDDQEEVIGGSKSGISLSQFRPKEIASGVIFYVAGQAITAKHAFIETMPNAGRPLVARRTGARTGARGRRFRKMAEGKRISSELPIEKLTYKSIFKQIPEHDPEIHKIARERFLKEFKASVDYYLMGK